MAITTLNLTTAYIADLFYKTNEIITSFNQLETDQNSLSTDYANYKQQQVQRHFDRDLAQTGLNFIVKKGLFLGKDGLIEIPQTQFTLTNDATNYISIDGNNNILAISTTYPDINMVLYEVVVSGGSQTTITDYRTWAISSISREEALNAAASDSVAAAIALGG